MRENKPIVAICGKGGVGKTVFCALFARALRNSGVQPVLLIDADMRKGHCQKQKKLYSKIS